MTSRARRARARAHLLAALFLPAAPPPLDDQGWDDVLHLAASQGVTGNLAARLLAPAQRRHVPARTQAVLAQRALETELRNRALLYDVLEITARLAGAGIPSLPLKGVALVAGGTHHAAVRHMGDVDLLVPRHLGQAAWALLLRSGCKVKEKGKDRAVDPDGGELARNLDLHQLPMLVTPLGSHVEIHVEAHGRYGRAADPFAALSVDAETVDVDGSPLRIPGPRALLEIACAHVVEHHRMAAAHWPRLLLDTDALARSGRAVLAPHELSWARADDRPLLVTAAVRAGCTPAGTRAERLLADACVFPTARWRLARLGGRAFKMGRSVVNGGPRPGGHAFTPAPDEVAREGMAARWSYVARVWSGG